MSLWTTPMGIQPVLKQWYVLAEPISYYNILLLLIEFLNKPFSESVYFLPTVTLTTFKAKTYTKNKSSVIINAKLSAGKMGNIMRNKCQTLCCTLLKVCWREGQWTNRYLSWINPDRPLHHTLDRQRSSFSNRLIEPRCHKDRYRKSDR